MSVESSALISTTTRPATRFFCERKAENRYTEIGSIDFLQRLKTSRCRQLPVYVHGFSNLPESVFEATAEFLALCNRAKKDEVLVVPIVCPCDNDLGIVKDYWDDQKAADQSAYSLARVMQRFLAWRSSEKYNPQDDPWLKRINVLAPVDRQSCFAWHPRRVEMATASAQAGPCR